MTSDSANFGQKSAAPPFAIGDVPLRNPVFLAPMSGVTDVPFRRLAWEFGAGMVVSEMVASEALTTGQEEMRLKAESAGLPVHMVQLAGRQPHWMAEATRMAEATGASIIDINMGCPAKRVTTGYSGSALMRDLDHALTLIEAVVAAASVPVTLKMRLGWDDNTINAPELARRAQDAGVQMVTVHGRTRCQFYKGKANWDRIADVSAATTLPLVVNGDIADAASARRAQSASGARAVMVGRAVYGAPWLPGQIAAELSGVSAMPVPTGRALAEFIARHHDAMLSHYGFELGIRNARKHLDWYLKSAPAQPDAETRKRLMTSRSPGDVRLILLDLFTRDADADCDVDGMAA